MTELRKTVDIKTVDEDERTATGAVLVPDELDHQHDFLRPDAVQNFQSDDVETGVMHAAFPDDAAELVRNEVLEDSEEIGDETFAEGTWVATRRYQDDDLWQLVADGVLQGFSIGGEISRAADHEQLPDDVRVPDDVDHESGGTELLAGSVQEVSDVDIPAVPRARYKGADLGKSILDDVDGESEFVELMVEQRGHDESEARRLYRYLAGARSKGAGGGRRDAAQKPVVLPNGTEFEDFDECVSALSEDMPEEQARRVCGAAHERHDADADRARDDPLTNEEITTVQEKNIDDPAFSEGDAVMWSSQDTPVHGRVAGIHEQFSPAGADVTITGDDGEAVYSIFEWDDSLAEPAFRDAPTQPNVAKPESSLSESSLEMPSATEEHFASKTMTDTAAADDPDDATKWRILKRVFFGSDEPDDAESAEVSDTKASDGDDEEEEDDEDDEDGDEMEDDKDATAGDTAAADMTDDDTTSDSPPEWAKSLTETVEQIEKRVDGLEDGDGTEKAMDDAPEWAQDLAEKVEDLDERVETINKQSGYSQQLDGTEKTADDETDRVESYKAGLVGGKTGGT